MDERPGWTWVLDAQAAILADVHHRHSRDWLMMPAGPGLELAMMLLQTPGTYTHHTQLTATLQTVEPTPAPAPERAAGPGAIRAAEGDYVRTTDAPMDDRWRKLADMNGVPGG
jgi:hypothetical protein